MSIERQAELEGVDPAEVVRQVNEREAAEAASLPPEEPPPPPPPPSEFDGMTLHQLRAALRAQGINPKGAIPIIKPKSAKAANYIRAREAGQAVETLVSGSAWRSLLSPGMSKP